MQALERYYKARYEGFKSLLKWRNQLPELLEAARSVLSDAEVYIFGSALKNELTANSDVDMLMVSDKTT
ncbi:MAG: nucleotidyltransferase domain-containing protein [Desulfurococcaceae archaeon]